MNFSYLDKSYKKVNHKIAIFRKGTRNYCRMGNSKAYFNIGKDSNDGKI